MNKITKITIRSAIIVSAISLASYFAKQTKRLKNACYMIAGTVINEISFRKMDFDLLISLSNKSDITFTIYNQEYTIFVNNMLVSTIVNSEKIKVLSRKTSVVKINVSFNPQDLLKKGIENINALLQNKDNLLIEIKGKLSLRAGIVSLKDYEVYERLSLKELLGPNKNKNKCN